MSQAFTPVRISRPIRILFVEEDPKDAELVARELTREKVAFSLRRVETPPDFVRALADFQPDVVLSDQATPGFDARAALEILKSQVPSTPFIIVTRSIDEAMAVECMRAGATDYVTQQHLGRLARSIRNALSARVEREARRKAESRLRLQGAALEAVANGVVITDRHGSIEWVNPAFTEMTGYSFDEAVGQNPRILRSGVHREAFYRRLWDTVASGGVWRGEVVNRRKDGTLYTEEMTVTPVRSAAGEVSHFVAVKQDVSDRKREEEELRRLSTTDSLTRLPNRDVLRSRAVAAIGRAQRGHPGALILIDLDDFHLLNVSQGASVGDRVLLQVADRLAGALRPGDLLARVGGDQFAILVEDVERDGARHTAEHLRAVVSDLRLTVGEHVFDTRASGGVALVDGSEEAETIEARADAALHAAKEQGKGRSVIWSPDLERGAGASEAARWAAQVKDALGSDRLVLHYQPVVSLTSGEVTHHEVLVRLVGEDGRVFLPGAFLPAAERFGLMPKLDRRVIEMALRALDERPSLKLFVNLSPRSLGDAGLRAWIESEVAGRKLEAGRLGFEITETAAVSDLVFVQDWIARMAEIGCSVAIDDFGTGYSTFAYLRSLPVRYVKIDGSFVRNVDADTTDRALVQAMVAVSHALGSDVVAEMVERPEVRDALRELGVDSAQGWFFGRPELDPVDQAAA